MKLGLYFHIPFCVAKCNYCSFVSSNDVSKMTSYHQSILKNVDLHSKLFKNHTVDSVYFGGGTPSVYFKDGIPDIIKAVRDSFNVAEDCEITAEANPESLTREKVEEWKNCGVNRMSIGLQSADDGLLKVLGRRHTAADFFRAYENAAAAGIENISADIMLGLPGQTLQNIKETIKVLYKLPFLRHLSAYALKIEAGTPMYDVCQEGVTGTGLLTKRCQPVRQGVTTCRPHDKALPDDDLSADMYDLTYKLLKEQGFNRYEVSNFAKDGFECRHNLKYWNLDEYLGIGVAAHSYYGGKRYAETNDINDYIAGEKPACAELNNEDIRTEYIMLKLRLERGIDLNDYSAKFGVRLEESNGAQFLLKHGLVGVFDGRLFILPDKFYVMNSIILKLI